jgi:hypothetical protein
MKTFFAALCCFFLMNCASDQPAGSFKVQQFMALDSIIDQQRSMLIGKPLTKSVLIGDDLESSSFEIDSAFILNEWSFLKEFDLNRPGFVGGIQTITGDNFVRYEPKEGQSYLLEHLQFTFDDDDQLLQISGALTDQKARSLYESTRSFQLNLSDGIVSEYIIFGYQKIVLNDTVFFRVSGSIQ